MRIWLLWLVAGSNLAAPGRAIAAACANPSLPPGQEEVVTQLCDPGDAGRALGMRPGNIRILRQHIAAEWTAAGGVRWVYLIGPSDGAHKGPRGAALQAQVVAPCQGHGPVPADAGRDLGSFVDLAATATAACPAELAQIDAAWFAALQVREATVRWRCGADLPAQGRMPAPTVGDRLRQVDAALQVGDRAQAEALIDRLAQIKPEALDPVARFDLGLALHRSGRSTAAAPLIDAALASFAGAWDLALAATAAADPAVILQAERAAAAHALAGRVAQGEAIVRACWQRFGDAVDAPGCTALALADALEAARLLDAAQGWLDDQLARSPRPPPAWFAARIGLASRRDDARNELRVAQRAVQTWPGDLAMQDALAAAYFRGGQHLNAVRTLEAIFRKDARHRGVLGRLSGVVNDWGRVDPAIPGQTSGWQTLRDEMARRAAADPDDTVAQFLHGVSLFYDAKFEDALRQMRAVEPRVHNEGRVYIYQAMAHLWLGHPDQARALADKAVVANPQDPDVYYCQSQVLRAADKPAAVAALERYLALETAAGSLHFAKKTHRVAQELALLRKGEMPPLWDKPGHFDDEDVAPPAAPTATVDRARPVGPKADRTLMWLLVGAGALVFIGGGTWLTRNKR
ncbi:MAG: hypothetical protein FJ100_17315 [Deltaproteobacteria bacterium]|nr:hypothetical protein [Deltaproteobacteria bacterium]